MYVLQVIDNSAIRTPETTPPLRRYGFEMLSQTFMLNDKILGIIETDAA